MVYYPSFLLSRTVTCSCLLSWMESLPYSYYPALYYLGPPAVPGPHLGAEQRLQWFFLAIRITCKYPRNWKQLYQLTGRTRNSKNGRSDGCYKGAQSQGNTSARWNDREQTIRPARSKRSVVRNWARDVNVERVSLQVYTEYFIMFSPCGPCRLDELHFFTPLFGLQLYWIVHLNAETCSMPLFFHHLLAGECPTFPGIFRLWQTRRVIWSKDVMTFSRIGEDTVFDSIPLTEIKGVEKIDESVIAGSSFHHRNSIAKKPRTNGIALASHLSTCT